MSKHSSQDSHIIALWLFDDPDYLSVTLSDAGENLYDLRLEKGGHLIPGRFGNALYISPDRGKATAFAWDTKLYYPPVPPEERPVTPPKRLIDILTNSDWTWEFWIKLTGAMQQDIAIVELGQDPVPMFFLGLAAGARSFTIKCKSTDASLVCPANPSVLMDNNWHHVAFTWNNGNGRLTHFLDGKLQGIGTNDPTTYSAASAENAKFDLAIGSTRTGELCMDGAIDEMRVSDVVRYISDFDLPGSFSRNYERAAANSEAVSFEPLLFASDISNEPIVIGTRKHLFIDEILIESKSDVHLTSNPPTRYDATDFVMDQDWELGSSVKAPNPGDCTAYEHNGEIRFIYNNGAQWVDWSESDRTSTLCMQVSSDGLHFEKPVLGLVEWNDSKENNILTTLPIQGHVVEDLNENVPEDERFKMPAYLMQRGIYMFTSPDGIHWRRNEVLMLPFDCGGGVEPLFDNQKGLYTCYIRNEAGLGGRSSSLAQTREPMKPWPFEPVENPPVRDVFTLPSLSKELPIPFIPQVTGDIYRTRAVKYAWAPDVYLAFVWRHTGEHPNDYRQVELAVSRDGISWTFFGDPYYIPAGWDFNGLQISEALSAFGLIRRGNDIWQYVRVKSGAHYDSSSDDITVRVTQRLDGFVSLGAEDGTIITRPLIFEGDCLELNLNSTGELRVAVLDEEHNPIAGFSAQECDPLKVDSTAARVTWQGNSDLGKLAGRPVRLQFEMKNTKIYAFQFC